MEKKIRWGLLGAGNIINRWIKGALQVEDMEIIAIASRTPESALKMAEKWKIPKVMTYDEMLESSDIDVVYIPVPHTAHKELAIRAMNSGKHVLVEKPAAVNAGEFQEMIECAKKNDVFLMEAVWTRFFPMMQKILDLISSGEIGDVRLVESTFSFRVEGNDKTRITDPYRAGGGLLDVGVYNLHLAQMIYGKTPVHLSGFASIDTDDYHLQVDEQAAYIGQYDKGELFMMMSGMRTKTEHTARIYGTDGYIIMPVFWKPTKIEIHRGDKFEIMEMPVAQKVVGVEDEGYQYHIAHVNDCIRKGRKESQMMTWESTLNVLKQMDKLRDEWGLKYPNEIS